MINNIRYCAITENSYFEKILIGRKKKWIVKPNNLDVYELELHCYLEYILYILYILCLMMFYSIWLSTRYWYIFVYTKIFNLNYETLCVGIEIVFSGHPVTEIMKLVPGYVHWICLIDVIGSSFTVTSWLTPKKIFFQIPVLYRIKRWKSDTLYLRNKSSFIIHILYLWKKSNKIFTVIAYFADEIIVPILFVKINKIFITWYEKNHLQISSG